MIMETDVIITTLKLAVAATGITLMLAIPCAWLLSRSRPLIKTTATSLLSLPLVLPPSVLGFYLLLLLGRNGGIGKLCAALGIGPLAFTFEGLVVAMVIYLFPFVLAPLQTACERLGNRPIEVAATLGASPLDRFLSVVLPQLRSAIITGAVAGIAHAIGAFGIVLMVGGSIPGKTRVMSTALYEYVETSRYGDAHQLAAVMMGCAFCMLLVMNGLGYGQRKQ